MIKYHVQCGKWGYTPNLIAWHPYQSLIATGSTLNYKQRHEITIWNTAGQLQQRLNCYQYVNDLRWVLNGIMLAVRTDNILLWNLAGKLLRTIPGFRMAWNPRYPQLISYSLKHAAWQLWDLAQATRIDLDYQLVPQEFKDTLQWSPCGEYLVGACNQQASNAIQLTIWLRTGQLFTQQIIESKHASRVIECIWHPSTQQIVIRTEIESILIDRFGQVLDRWELSSGQREWEGAICFQWSPAGDILAQATQTGVQLRDLSGRQTSIELNAIVMALTWHPSGEFLAIAPWNNQIQLWDRHGNHLATSITDVEEVGARMIMIPFIFEWDVTGCYLAASLRGCTVHLWRYEPELTPN